MPLITEEQKEKAKGQFLKLEDKARFTLFSNMYKLITHFLEDEKMSVLCQEEDECKFCKYGHKATTQYYYFAKVNEDEGIVRIPASVFFQLNEQERVTGKDKRNSVWIISKKGTGIETKYTVAKDDNAGTPSISLEDANEKLGKAMLANESVLQQNYKSKMSMFVEDDKKVKQATTEYVDPEDVPF